MKRQNTELIAIAVAVLILAVSGIYHLRTNAVADNERQSGSATSKPGWVSLETELPATMFEGTPKDIKVANLRKLEQGVRPPFLVPAGTKNVALGKPVTASEADPIIGEIDMITDGDKEGADGSFVEMGPFLQHVTIDLEETHEIFAVLVWHYHKEARAYLDVIVQTADDPDFITNVTTLFNNDIDNSAGLGVGTDMNYVETHKGELIDAKGVETRYIRLYSNGNSHDDLNHYVEVEVYGKPLR